MPTVREEGQRGHTINRSTWRNVIRRVFIVTDLDDDPKYMLMQALAQPEIPPWQTPYPFSVTPEYPAYQTCRVVDQIAEPIGPNSARITVVYSNDYGSLSSPDPAREPAVGENEGPEIRNVSYSFREYETEFDRSGTEMILAPPPSHASEKSYRFRSVSLVTVAIIRFERTERKDPTPTMRSAIRRLNNAPIGPYATNTVRFNGVSSSGNEQDLFRCSYEFEWDEAGWKGREFWRDAEGKIPVDGVLQEFDLLQETDFSAFNFNWSDL